MQNTLNITFIMVGVALLSNTTFAKKINLGETPSELNELEVSGWLRANVQDKSFSDDEHKLKFDAAKLELRYTNNQFQAELEYRCYQFDTLCDFSSLVDANASYTFSPKHSIKLGIQDIPFGPARNWSSNWYGGLLVNTGLEDIHNIGIKYQYPLNESTDFELAYFAQDAGKYTGKSLDSARYTANFVDTHSQYSHLEEKNMWLARAQHKIRDTGLENLSLNLGGSYWYSDIENQSYNKTGERNSWALFGQFDYQALKVSLTGGQNKLNNQDPIYPDHSMVGSFDSAYAVANDGYFYTADLLYTFSLANNSSLSPYLTWSHFDKSIKGFSDSTRYIFGAQWDYKKISLVGEYIIGKNDLFIGGDELAFAHGEQNASSESMLNLLFLYKF